ncbi:hypothetical protein Ade02nite_00620 [Paractinoplanes deccanensis]|uniref:DUF6745 domain-containing protein n=1 Tax=Paractinoplanes deccanensis TaxID=113561 RepID=A0ABQ3XUL2_9ACTN|nr:hypothetical protein [Actinoplanes deccanensis]GID71421.1 hypothetical protein Ade02nite_00620 [Actinoplanes deccanensis]
MQLTHAQEAMAAAIEDQWLAAAMETGPADRAAAESGVREAYRLAGATPPEQIFWLGSPRAGAAAAALLAGATPPGSSATGALPDGSTSSPGAASDRPASPSAAVPGVSSDWFGEVHAELRRQGWTPGSPAGPSMRRRVRTEPWAAARKAAAEALGNDGWAQLSAAAGRRSWPLVMDLVAGRLRLRLSEDLTASFPGGAGRPMRTAVLDAIYGQHDGTWLATFEAADRLAPDAGLMAGLAGLADVSRHAGWWWATERYAVLTERPTVVTRDNVGRLHRGEGPAMEFPDGYGLWAWRGMPIPPELVAELPTLTVARIRKEKNAELRRVMLEHFGYERYLREAGARNLGSDETGTLWHLDLPGDEPLVMVEVVNSTPEPDGTSRVYWLRVPPETRSAREGVAWTFGLTADEYQPVVQT